MVFLFFFFQAEDGIRDLTVTGVQTCALPIYLELGGLARRAGRSRSRRTGARALRRLVSQRRHPPAAQDRSGERRVGEECRSRGAPDHLKKKKKNTNSPAQSNNQYNPQHTPAS